MVKEKRAIVIGASSGIGRELAMRLSRDGWVVGLAARRRTMLEDIQRELPLSSFVQVMDIARDDEVEDAFNDLTARIGGADLVVISAGTGYLNPELDWEKERATIEVNIKGFAAVANAAMKHFLARGAGHLAGISSVAGVRGNGTAPAYSASKAFVSNYLEGLRCAAKKSGADITVTDIVPGYVDTEMAKGEGLFWVASPETAARQIVRALIRKKPRVYVTRRWALVAMVLRHLPGWMLARF
ncbi:MAG: SDR family NAD(P)-dependent oxidoreductase [Spirochaetes bacterium]|nr:MAG: SDR family NAD(P)-dependent oxidoreductase [Spirochaetota bacterium]